MTTTLQMTNTLLCSGQLTNRVCTEKSKEFLSALNLKSDSHLPTENYFICFNDSSSKLIKNVFYFILKALFVLKIFKFFS